VLNLIKRIIMQPHDRALRAEALRAEAPVLSTRPALCSRLQTAICLKVRGGRRKNRGSGNNDVTPLSTAAAVLSADSPSISILTRGLETKGIPISPFSKLVEMNAPKPGLTDMIRTDGTKTVLPEPTPSMRVYHSGWPPFRQSGHQPVQVNRALVVRSANRRLPRRKLAIWSGFEITRWMIRRGSRVTFLTDFRTES
jgi:hypothetical protein